MTETKDESLPLTPGGERLVQGAAQEQASAGSGTLSTYHWLLALLDRHGPMAASMTDGIDPLRLQRYLRDQMRGGQAGDPLDSDTVLKRARERAQSLGKSQVSERDLAAVILAASGYTVREPSVPVTSTTTAQTQQPRVDQEQPEATGYRPRAARPTPALEQWGRELTRAAGEGRLAPVVGRESEIQLMIETLCRTTKRNPALVGPAGVGKTAIVEGFAERVVRGDVPPLLRNVRVIEIQPSVVVAGSGIVGELQERMKAILSEASQEGIVLFIDELHSMIGAGGQMGSSDVASLLKPALARGDLACIAATTDEEYRRFIEPDAALERRFQPIRVQELTAEQTLAVLRSLREELQRARGVKVPDEVLVWLVDFAADFLHNRFFPDKAVDLLEQCVAHAVTQGKTELTPADAEEVAQRMVGMPLAPRARLEALGQDLSARALLTETDARTLLNHLAVTVRGLDLRSCRPNAVVLLIGEAADNAGALASVVAGSLFGAADRVVSIDFSRFTHAEDLTMLIGAPPGYVGYNESLPLYRLIQMPWCVLMCINIQSAHPQVLSVLAQALREGTITDARGRRIYLSDAVVILTATGAGAPRHIGFRLGDEEVRDDAVREARDMLGTDLVDQADLVCAAVPSTAASRRAWLESSVLTELTDRYHKQGLELRFEPDLIDWLLAQQKARATEHDWERLVDERLSPLLIPHLPDPGWKQPKKLVLRHEGGNVDVQADDM